MYATSFSASQLVVRSMANLTGLWAQGIFSGISRPPKLAVQLQPGVPPHQNKRNTKSHLFSINTIKDLLNEINKRLYGLIISILEKYIFQSSKL
jgi:hypothetical protein